MRAEITFITPDLAKELLKKNIGNRRMKGIKNAYVGQMLNGEWKENGEPIIIDTEGIIKDGQHRLNACIEADFSWICPIIYDVKPDVMSTIDTGSNRSLNDILQLNGFNRCNDMASLIKGVISYQKGLIGINDQGSTMRISRTKYISNNNGLEFAREHHAGLSRIIKTAESVYTKQTVKVLSRKELGVFLYMIGGFSFGPDHLEFMKMVAGVIVKEDSVTTWLYRKLSTSKLGKATLKYEYKHAAFVKVWNLYASGDMSVKDIRVDSKVREKVQKL